MEVRVVGLETVYTTPIVCRRQSVNLVLLMMDTYGLNDGVARREEPVFKILSAQIWRNAFSHWVWAVLVVIVC